MPGMLVMTAVTGLLRFATGHSMAGVPRSGMMICVATMIRSALPNLRYLRVLGVPRFDWGRGRIGMMLMMFHMSPESFSVVPVPVIRTDESSEHYGRYSPPTIP